MIDRLRETPLLALLERLVVFGIVAGIAGMLQPWDIRLYENGFYLLAVSTLAFIVISHLPGGEDTDARTTGDVHPDGGGAG